MLPDFPALKAELERFANQYIRAAIRLRLGPFRDIRGNRLHEGPGLVVNHLPDGTTTTNQTTTGQASRRVTPAQMRTMDFKEVIEVLNGLAEDMALEYARRFEAAIQQGASTPGIGLAWSEQAFTAEGYLAQLRHAGVGFHPDGKPEVMMPIAHSAARELIDRELQRLMSDPALRLEFELILAEQKEVWNAREASRKLVG